MFGKLSELFVLKGAERLVIETESYFKEIFGFRFRRAVLRFKKLEVYESHTDTLKIPRDYLLKESSKIFWVLKGLVPTKSPPQRLEFVGEVVWTPFFVVSERKKPGNPNTDIPITYKSPNTLLPKRFGRI